MTVEVENALRELEARNRGRLTPAAVVAAARPARSVLHSYFTWDDREAGAAHRLNEARALIRSFEYVITTTPVVVSAPIWVRDPSAPAGEQGYVSTSRLKTRAELAREVITRECESVVSSLERALAVAAAVGMTREIEQLLRRVDQLAGRAMDPAG